MISVRESVALILLCLSSGIWAVQSTTDPGKKNGGSDNTSTPASDATKADVRRVQWWMTPDQVRAQEAPVRPHSATRYQLEYRDTIFSEKAKILYAFQVNKLVSVDIILDPGMEKAMPLHRALQKALTDKYGDPTNSLQGRYGHALYLKNTWAIARTTIELSSISGGVKISYSARDIKKAATVYAPGKGDKDKL